MLEKLVKDASRTVPIGALAARCGLSPTYLYDIRAGRRIPERAETLQRLADGLGLGLAVVMRAAEDSRRARDLRRAKATPADPS